MDHSRRPWNFGNFNQVVKLQFQLLSDIASFLAWINSALGMLDAATN